MVPANRLARPKALPVAALETTDFAAVYRAYFGFAWRCLQGLGVPAAYVDDAAQDVFVIVHRQLAGFRGDSTLRTWLYGIVRNVAANYRRSQRRRPVASILEIELESPAAGPHEDALEREAAQFLQVFLMALEPSKRELFVLVFLEELKVIEAAEMLQIPLNTAYTRLRSLRHAFTCALQRRK